MTTPEDVERAKRDAARGDVVTVRWKCKKVVGQTIGKGDRTRAVRCRESFERSTSRDEYEAKQLRARCPSCGGMLTQQADGCDEVRNV